MLEFVGQAVLVFVDVDRGGCCLEQIPAVNEVRQGWTNLRQKVHQLPMSHRRGEGRVRAADRADLGSFHLFVSAFPFRYFYTRARAYARRTKSHVSANVISPPPTQERSLSVTIPHWEYWL